MPYLRLTIHLTPPLTAQNGVVVPEPLRPYTCGVEFIPFRKEFDKNGKLVDRAAPKPDASMGSVN